MTIPWTKTKPHNVYRGSLQPSNGWLQSELRRRIRLASSVTASVQRIWKSASISLHQESRSLSRLLVTGAVFTVKCCRNVDITCDCCKTRRYERRRSPKPNLH